MTARSRLVSRYSLAVLAVLLAALLHAALDPVSRIPEFKVCAVRIEKALTLARSQLEPAATAHLH